MASNERLRAAILEAGETYVSVAEAVSVDPKTVERWVKGRVPYTNHRHLLARHLDADVTWLWPGALAPAQVASASASEIVQVHPHRWALPREALSHLFDDADEEIGVLVYSGIFFADDAGVLAMLRSKAAAGVRVRILIGDPDSPQLETRGEEEEIGDSLAAKARNAIVLLRPLSGVDGVEIRLHSTTLYNSIFRGDDQLLVNTHVYGVPAAQAPVMHLRQVAGGTMVQTYLDSFERVWAQARPLTTER
jgi:hypothetical protein